MEMLMLGCLFLVLIGLGGLIYLGMSMYDKHITHTIETKYPDYVRAEQRARNLAHKNIQYYNQNVRHYEKLIEENETKLRWLPKEERDKIIEEIENYKSKRLEFYKIYEVRAEEVHEAYKILNAVRAAHPWLQKHT